MGGGDGRRKRGHRQKPQGRKRGGPGTEHSEGNVHRWGNQRKKNQIKKKKRQTGVEKTKKKKKKKQQEFVGGERKTFFFFLKMERGKGGKGTWKTTPKTG